MKQDERTDQSETPNQDKVVEVFGIGGSERVFVLCHVCGMLKTSRTEQLAEELAASHRNETCTRSRGAEGI